MSEVCTGLFVHLGNSVIVYVIDKTDRAAIVVGPSSLYCQPANTKHPNIFNMQATTTLHTLSGIKNKNNEISYHWLN